MVRGSSIRQNGVFFFLSFFFSISECRRATTYSKTGISMALLCAIEYRKEIGSNKSRIVYIPAESTLVHDGATELPPPSRSSDLVGGAKLLAFANIICMT